MKRNLTDYQNKYIKLPYEFHQANIRRSELLKVIKKIRPKQWCEVGCGMLPLFLDYYDSDMATVIEPGDLFFRNLKKLSNTNPEIKTKIYNCRIEDIHTYCDFDKNHDLIIVSALLHEVHDKNTFLECLRKMGNRKTKYIFTVPNAHSLHRMLALRLGIIKDLYQISDQQKCFSKVQFIVLSH